MSPPPGRRPVPTVSVVLLREGPVRATVTSLRAVADLDWDPGHLDVVIVDLDGDGESRRLLKQESPAAVIVRAGGDGDRARALNQGADAATGHWLAFLGAGITPGRDWLRAAIGLADEDSSVSCVAGRVVGTEADALLWPPALSFTGHPLPATAGPASAPQGDVLYASLDAMVVKAEVFQKIGGFDERYGRGGEDVDLGWRLWLAGHRVRILPDTVVIEAGRDRAARPDGGDGGRSGRNALFTIYKNYDEASLGTAFAAALTLTDDREAVDGFVAALPGLAVARAGIQAHRQRTDQEIFGLFRLPLQPHRDDAAYLAAFTAAVDAFGVGRRFGSRRRIVVATCDTLTPKMAGPAIRAWQIASALSVEHEVVLVSTSQATLTSPRFDVRRVDDAALQELERWCEVFVFQGWVMVGRPFLKSSRKIVVADVYDPMHLEQLEQTRDEGSGARLHTVRTSTAVLNHQLGRGDFFLCASQKQRDFWLGHLAALGRVNPLTYDEDHTLSSLIAIAPFGLPEEPPLHSAPAIKGVVPGIGLDDKVILWGGGIYNWFDPLTLIEAVHRLRDRVPSVRLFFMGLRHPNPDIPQMQMAVAARDLSERLGLTGSHVFFNEGWVDYDQRQNFLLEADVGVSVHLDHIEAALSFRTRVLDYLWASLPIVATKGDSLADVIETKGLGITVEPNDVDALEAALFRMLTDEGFHKTCSENAAGMVADLRWSQVLRPLVEFCRHPRRAPDLMDPDAAGAVGRDLGDRPVQGGWRQDVRKSLEYLQWGGVGLLARKSIGRVRGKLTG